MPNSWSDAREIMERAEYELSKTRRRTGTVPTRAPKGSRPAIVETECSAADGTGNATTDGRCWFMDHDDTGAAQILTPPEGATQFYNIFQGAIPVDVVIWVIKYKSRWYLVAADCEPETDPPPVLRQPITEATDGDTMQDGDGTVLII